VKEVEGVGGGHGQRYWMARLHEARKRGRGIEMAWAVEKE